MLQASRAPVAVLFRRGPSKRVEVVRWDTAADRFERGHWFHGRIYARRCDLSPDGELLVYFASKFTRRTVGDREYTYAWTAVSRPPWLTALALWPKGDCWHGGGLFTGPRALRLNHRPEAAAPHPRHRPAAGLVVTPDPEARGEDDPLYSRRLARDGWQLRQAWVLEQRGYPEFFRTSAPEVRARAHPGDECPLSVVLERRLDGLTYRERFSLKGARGPVALPGPELEWLDWDHSGRLVALADGRVWAASVTNAGEVSAFAPLLDLRGDVPETREAPPAARAW